MPSPRKKKTAPQADPTPVTPTALTPEATAQADAPKTYKQLLADLSSAKQRRFVREYVSGANAMNATKAAKAAGYSPDTARQMGSENLSKPDIAAAVEAGLEQVMGRNEVRARTAEVAAATMEDFLSIERVPYTDEVFMDVPEALDLITDTIADLSEELDSADEERSAWIGKEIKRLRRLERRCERARDKAEDSEEDEDAPASGRSRKRDAQVLVDIEWKTRVVVRIDLERARDAGKLHLLKKVKETKYGMEIELYDAAAARELLGKHYRLWGDRLALENPDGTPLPIKFIIGVPADAV